MTPKPRHSNRPQRRRRVGYMTIAAGFQFNGGILICADSQFSSPSIKFFDTKLSELHNSDESGTDVVNTVVGMAGTDGYMQMVVDKVEDAIGLAYLDGELDPSRIKPEDVIEEALVAAYKKHIYPHPHYGYTDGPQVQFACRSLVRW